MFYEAELIRKSIAHNNQVTDSAIKRGDFVRLLNKRGAFEKEGQRFTLKVYIVEEVGLNSLNVEGRHQKKVLSLIGGKVKDQERKGYISTII